MVPNPEVTALGGVFMRNADLFMPIVDPFGVCIAYLLGLGLFASSRSNLVK